MLRAKGIARLLIAWIATVTAGHLTLNVQWDEVLNEFRSGKDRLLHVAYIPVT